MKNHGLWMLIGCVVPLLLIFLLPALGVSSDATIVVFIVLMLACHLFMGHRHGQHEEHEGVDVSNPRKHHEHKAKEIS